MINTRSYQAYMNSPYKSIKHNSYFQSYDEILGKFYGNKVTFIEVGVLNGGSLFMWRELFGVDSRIIGIDFNPSALAWQEFGFEIYIGDQADPEFWDSILSKIGNFDILLDDGGHLYNQQINTVASVLHAANEGGLIIVEDTHTSYMSGFGPQKWSFINYAFEMVDRINRRSSAIDSKGIAEHTIHSVQFFESITAFSISKLHSQGKSYPTQNLGIDSLALDYRTEGQALRFLEKFRDRLLFLGRFLPRGRNVWKYYISYNMSKIEKLTLKASLKFGIRQKRIKKFFRRSTDSAIDF
jgi:hypothetical protein